LPIYPLGSGVKPAHGVPPRCSGLWPESTWWLLIVAERRIQFAVAQTPGTEPSESNTPTANVAGADSALPSASEPRDPAHPFPIANHDPARALVRASNLPQRQSSPHRRWVRQAVNHLEPSLTFSAAIGSGYHMLQPLGTDSSVGQRVRAVFDPVDPSCLLRSRA
jgi:hypothetical protein